MFGAQSPPKNQSNMFWRMPISFGPFPGPRQDYAGQIRRTDDSRFVTSTIKIKTSRSLLENLFPTPAFQFVSPDEFQHASYTHTRLENLDWLGGGGYNYVGFYIHGVRYNKQDGTRVDGSFLVLMLEDLSDPILSGREELGFPKLFCDIQGQQNGTTVTMDASWRSAQFLRIVFKDLEELPAEPTVAERSDGGTLVFKYIPATGQRGVADVEYPVHVPEFTGSAITRRQKTKNAYLQLDPQSWKALPTLHHVIAKLAQLPVTEVVEGLVTEGRGWDDLASAYRLE